MDQKGHKIDQKGLKVYEKGLKIEFLAENTEKTANLTGTRKWGQKPFVLPYTIRQGDQVVVPDIFFHHSSGEEKNLNFKPEVQPDELAAREKETCW